VDFIEGPERVVAGSATASAGSEYIAGTFRRAPSQNFLWSKGAYNSKAQEESSSIHL